MMQNVVQEQNNETNNEIRTVEIEQAIQTPLPSSDKSQVLSTSQPTFGPDMSGSDDDEVSEVDSFILDQDLEDADQVLEPSKFLLPTDTMDGANLQTVDPETHARLEALLEAAGIGKLSTADGKALTDPEVLRKLTSSVSCALDEAAQALHRMRAEQQGQLGSEGILDAVSARSLAEACSDGDVPTVRKLLHEGGSVHETTEEGESLLSLACSAGYYELAQVLLAMKANVEDRGIKGDCTPLMEAASGGYVDIVKLLIAHGADVNAQSSAGNTPLHYAACGGYEDVVQVLIEARANVEQHNENGHTPLMEAASAGHVGVAKLLLRAGAGINTHSNEFKESALTLACYKGHLEMVKFLLEAGADQEHKTDEMHTALMEASMDGHVEVARLLLDSGAQVGRYSDVNMPADSFESPLTLAACGGHVELANLLIERGANLEEVNDEGYTPLMEAAREGHEEMVALLLAHGADINAQTEETQETALTLACCGGFQEVADFLIKAGADMELGCSTPLMEAAQEGHLDLVRYLLRTAGANVHAQTGTGDTALTYACENGHTDVAEILLQHGAELEHESEGGRTPLMKAARAGHLCTVQFLITKGADVNRQTSTNDHTVLSLACAGGHLAVVELLLAHGADSAHKLKDGSTMIIEAAKGGHTQVVKLLLEYPNKMLMNSSDLAQLSLEPHLAEARVPIQGLGNIVPPSEPDSQPSSTNNFSSNIQTGSQNINRKTADKDLNIPARSTEQILQNMQKSLGKRSLSGGGEGSRKSSKTSHSSVIPDTSSQFTENGGLSDLPDETVDIKASERLEAIINNVMAKELINTTSTREEQILRKQQILEELQKVERELQEKAQAQLLLSAQHQLEQHQQQQQLQQVLQGTKPIHKVLQKQLEEQVKRKREDSPNFDSASGDGSSSDASVDTQTANDLDRHISRVLSAEESTGTQIVIPNIYEGLLPMSNQALVDNSAMLDGTTGSSQDEEAEANEDVNQEVLSVETQLAQAGVTSVDHNGGSQSQSEPPAKPALDASQRQQLHNIMLAYEQREQQQQLQQQQTQTIQFPQLQLSPQQQDQLLQMLSQQTVLQQQQTIVQQQFPPQALPQQPLPQQPLPRQPLPLPQLLPQPQTIQQPLTQQYLSQQQQQQLLQQQQQQQQLLQQQLQQQQQIKPPPPATITNPQKPSLHKHTHIPQQPPPPSTTNILGIETITPPPSTPLTPNPSPASPQSISPLYAPIDLDAQTESNHDTALTLACAGGHSELVSLLLSNRADIEHRDKKGFTPLILAATAGHVDVVEILLDHGADIEAQSERTKDTPLSLACSGGRYEVVELLLARGANKEHRNVSDYTPLSLAASGGYVNIIKLLLSHGAEINSRTGSKLGISPLMLAAMNGHTAAVKLLLDMGSDINAQIETNRNTALTLACFQGRHEVVSLLVDRKANIEHRAKTGLTPLMEAASGGYVEVGRVLLDKGADVNAPPVPSSRDTALTIAADKGHYRFVELLLTRGAIVDVKNKKGNSPLWLACNGGHLDVVQLLVSAGADIDSQDNRKVSCLMAAFRKGHVKVVKWMVKHVNQFPSDQELSRYIATVTDKDLQKKCQQCMEIIVSAKDRQAAEANKNASILLEELDKERQHEENKKAAAAKKREKRKKKKKQKQEKEKDVGDNGKNSSPEPESSDSLQNQELDLPDNKDDEPPDVLPPPVPPEPRVFIEPPSATTTSTLGTTLPTVTEPKMAKNISNKTRSSRDRVQRERERESTAITTSAAESRRSKKNRRDRDRPMDSITSTNSAIVLPISSGVITSTTITVTSSASQNSTSAVVGSKRKVITIKPSNPTGRFQSIGDLDDFGTLPTLPEAYRISDKEIEKLRKTMEKTKINGNIQSHGNHAPTKETLAPEAPSANTLSLKTSPVIASPKRGQKKEEGWKEVIRKSKKVQVPSSAISRVIGRGGCNINAIREVSGAHIEVEKQRGSGERIISIKGSADATRQAHALITALVTDPDKELNEILPQIKNKLSKENSQFGGVFDASVFTVPNHIGSQQTGETPGNSQKMSPGSKSLGSRGQSGIPIAGNIAIRSTTHGSSGGGPHDLTVWGNTPPPPVTSPRRSATKQPLGFPGPGPHSTSSGEKTVTRQLFPNEKKVSSTIAIVTTTSTTVTYSIASTTMKMTSASTPSFESKSKTRSSSGKSSQNKGPVPGSVRVLQRPSSLSQKQEPQPLPIITTQANSNTSTMTTASGMVQVSSIMSTPVSTPGDYSPFNNMFNNVAEQLMGKKDDLSERMNFASVAAAGVVASLAGAGGMSSVAAAIADSRIDQALQAKAPGYKPCGRTISPQEMMPDGMKGFKSGFQMPPQMMSDLDLSRISGSQGGMQSPGMSPRSNTSTPSGLSPRGPASMLDSSQHSLSSLSSVSSQKEEYTTPNQPMTLPKIESTLNPNAPDFTSRTPFMNNQQGDRMGLPPNFMFGPNTPAANNLQALYQQAISQQLLSQAGFGGMPPNPQGNFVPPSPLTQQELNQNFANLIQQLSNQQLSNQAQGPAAGFIPPQNIPRAFSPLPPQARPSSAPSMGGMPKDGSSPTPIGPPNAASPLPSTTPPLPDHIKMNMEERKQPRPIGGERTHRKAPGAGAGGGMGDFGVALWGLSSELNMEWPPGGAAVMSSATIPTSVMTSSVITGGHMAPSVTPQSEGRPPVGADDVQNSQGFIDGNMANQSIDPSFQKQAMMIPLFANGVPPGQYPGPPMFPPQPGGGRDSMSHMWNSQEASGSETVGEGMWNNWSQQSN